MKCLGLETGYKDTCISRNSWLIVYFYGDDIGLLYRPWDKPRAKVFVEKLQEKFILKDLGPNNQTAHYRKDPTDDEAEAYR